MTLFTIYLFLAKGGKGSGESSDEDGKSSRSPRPSGYTKATKPSVGTKETATPSNNTRPTYATRGTPATHGTTQHKSSECRMKVDDLIYDISLSSERRKGKR